MREMQRLVMQATWNRACDKHGGISEFGIAAFNIMLTRKPEYARLIEAFHGIPLDKLQTHPQLNAEATVMFCTLNMLIENLGDDELTGIFLQKLGKDHIPSYIKQEHFEEFGKVLIVLLESTLEGSVFTSFVKSSWNRALSIVVSGIVAAMKSEVKSHHEVYKLPTREDVQKTVGCTQTDLKIPTISVDTQTEPVKPTVKCDQQTSYETSMFPDTVNSDSYSQTEFCQLINSTGTQTEFNELFENIPTAMSTADEIPTLNEDIQTEPSEIEELDSSAVERSSGYWTDVDPLGQDYFVSELDEQSKEDAYRILVSNTVSACWGTLTGDGNFQSTVSELREVVKMLLNSLEPKKFIFVMRNKDDHVCGVNVAYDPAVMLHFGKHMGESPENIHINLLLQLTFPILNHLLQIPGKLVESRFMSADLGISVEERFELFCRMDEELQKRAQELGYQYIITKNYDELTRRVFKKRGYQRWASYQTNHLTDPSSQQIYANLPDSNKMSFDVRVLQQNNLPGSLH